MSTTRKATADQLASMQAACPSCEMNLNRLIKNAMNIMKESGDPSRDGATFAMHGQMEDAAATIKRPSHQVCRDHQDHLRQPRANGGERGYH
jgi:hypothetical protein